MRNEDKVASGGLYSGGLYSGGLHVLITLAFLYQQFAHTATWLPQTPHCALDSYFNLGYEYVLFQVICTQSSFSGPEILL